MTLRPKGSRKRFGASSGSSDSNGFEMVLVSTFPPRQCGLATFSEDLIAGMEAHLDGSPIKVAAISNATYSYPERVKWEIAQEIRESYIDVANLINSSQADLVLVQHEFGIFGGRNGEYVLDFMEALRPPIVTTFHSVLLEPDDHRYAIVRRIGELSSALVVMAQKGRETLVTKYGIPQWKVHVIHHGVPDLDGFLPSASVSRLTTSLAQPGDHRMVLKLEKPLSTKSRVAEAREGLAVVAGASLPATVLPAKAAPLAVGEVDRLYGPKARTDVNLRPVLSQIKDESRSVEQIKRDLGYEGKQLLTTFGLLSPSKGIEYVLRALPSIVERHPEVVYLILGETHPVVKKLCGESYRRKLKKWVKEMGIDEHVSFVDRYLSKEDLLTYLRITDIYITPYPNPEQISSGTLAYAVGMGKAVVSTPYIYAQELLDKGRGILVEFRSPDSIAQAVNQLLDDPSLKARLEANAREYGREMTWTKVGGRYLDVIGGVLGIEIPGTPKRVLEVYGATTAKEKLAGRAKTK
ncbi:MAG TPA: glycosyltransferase [Clostridia bacterium]|nr:glycosyltransferase [Clostridia bacterium]